MSAADGLAVIDAFDLSGFFGPALLFLAATLVGRAVLTLMIPSRPVDR